MPRFDDGSIDMQELLRRLAEQVVNAVMDAEADQLCGGGANSRNGYRPRSLKTAVGDVELEIPKLRHGTYYPEGMLARWSRVDTSVAAIVQEMYVCGVSTRKVERVASKLGISSLSSSEVSSLCSDLDAEVAEFRRRDLSGTPCCYLWLDATYMMLASIYFSPFSPTYFRQSRQRGCAGFANADAPLSASRLPPPSRPHRRWIRPSGGTTVPLS